MATRPPLPPFTRDTAIEKVRLAEDAVGGALGPSTPKSQTNKFIPSGKISASAYSPGGNGSPSVNRYTVAATSHLWIAIDFRSVPISCPNRLRIDSNSLLFPFTVARTNSTSGPDSPGRLLRYTLEFRSGSGGASRK